MRRTLIVIAAVLYAVLLCHSICFGVGGSDSSGYFNAARLMAAGRLHERVRLLDELHLDSSWTNVFMPLGMVVTPRSRNIGPSYPLGFPAHLVLPAVVGHWGEAPYYVSPFAAILCLMAIYVLARDQGLSESWAVAAAAILAVSPPFVNQAIQPMSDVVATLWCCIAILCAFRAPTRSPGWAVAAGVAFAIAVWVRPADLLLAPAFGFAMRWQIRPLVRSIAAAAPFAAALFVVNRILFGSATTTGYGPLGEMISASFVFERLPHYGKWLTLFETPLIFPLGIFLVLDRRVPASRRALLMLWFFAFFGFYCFYSAYDSPWYTRFLLPAFPALIVAALIVIRDAVGERARIAPVVVALIVVATGLWHFRHSNLGKLHLQEETYGTAIRWAERRLPPRSLVVSSMLSGSFLFYSDRDTARYEALDPDRFELLRAYAGAADFHWYAVVFDWEEPELFRHLPGHWKRIDSMKNVDLLMLDR